MQKINKVKTKTILLPSLIFEKINKYVACNKPAIKNIKASIQRAYMRDLRIKELRSQTKPAPVHFSLVETFNKAQKKNKKDQ